MKIDNCYIYSRYNPLNEVVRYWDGNVSKYQGKDGIIIYGIGLGYHISELLSRVDENFKIVAFDIDEEAFDCVKHTSIIKKICQYNNVRLLVGESENNVRNFSECIRKYENFILIDSIFKSIPQKFSKLKDVLYSFKLGETGIRLYGDKMDECLESNKSLTCKEIADFIDNSCFKETIVLVSSGPSFDEEAIKFLKDKRDKITIFAVSRSLSGLINNKILPDMFSMIDCSDLMYEHIREFVNCEVPFVFLDSSNNLSVKKYNGPKFVFSNVDKGQKYIVNTGRSVSTAILDIAIKCCPKNIVFIGQDLAYIRSSNYSDYASFSYDESITNGSVKVTSVSGSLIDTSRGFLEFKRCIENSIQQNNGINYINLSLGVDIKGTHHMSINQFEKML